MIKNHNNFFNQISSTYLARRWMLCGMNVFSHIANSLLHFIIFLHIFIWISLLGSMNPDSAPLLLNHNATEEFMMQTCLCLLPISIFAKFNFFFVYLNRMWMVWISFCCTHIFFSREIKIGFCVNVNRSRWILYGVHSNAKKWKKLRVFKGFLVFHSLNETPNNSSSRKAEPHRTTPNWFTISSTKQKKAFIQNFFSCFSIFSCI